LAEQLHSRQHRDQHQQYQQYQQQQQQQHSKARQSPLASDDTAALLPVVTGGRGPSAVDEAGPAARPASWRQRSWSRLPQALQTAGRYLGRVAWGQLFPLPSQAAILGESSVQSSSMNRPALCTPPAVPLAYLTD
jgi:hypothetical protein